MKNLNQLNKKNISFFTGSRSEFDIFFPLINKLSENKNISNNIIISGSHFDKKYGYTIKYVNSKIKNLKIKNISKINIDIKRDISFISSQLILKVSKIIKKNNIHFLILVGDRYEAMSTALSCFLNQTKIIHFHGGETTKNMIDEQFRYCISKLSSYHFVSTQNNKINLIKNSIKKNIFVVGSMSLSNLFEKTYNQNLPFLKKSYVLFTYHPISNEEKNISEVKEVFKALKKLAKNFNFIITSPNQDPGNQLIFDEIESLVSKNNKKVIFVESLGAEKYFNLIKNSLFVMGNSSSGIIEVASFGKYFLNIGERQYGRERSRNTLDAKAEYKDIMLKFDKVFSKSKINKTFKNIYHKRNTLQIVVKKINRIIQNEN